MGQDNESLGCDSDGEFATWPSAQIEGFQLCIARARLVIISSSTVEEQPSSLQEKSMERYVNYVNGRREE